MLNLHAEEFQNNKIACITLPVEWQVTTNKDICEAFWNYYQVLFMREPGLSPTQLNSYLDEFSHFDATKAAGCKGLIREYKIREALKLVNRDKTPKINNLLYKLYLRQLFMFVPLLELIFNNWMKYKVIPQHFNRGVITLLCKDKYSVNRISNFRPLIMLNTVLKFLAKILANHWQAVLLNLIVYEQISAVKDGTIQNKLHFVCSIIEYADSEAVLINPRHLIVLTILS